MNELNGSKFKIPGPLPGRKPGTIDNRDNHFYLALHGAQQLAAQNEEAELKTESEPIAEALTGHEAEIVEAAMRPSGVWNGILG